MSEKAKTIRSASKIFHNRYIKGNKKALKYIEEEHKRVEIAQKIYALRTQANLTQKELAKRIHTRQSVISRLEAADYNGHTYKMLERIAEATNTHLKVEFVPLGGRSFAF